MLLFLDLQWAWRYLYGPLVAAIFSYLINVFYRTNEISIKTLNENWEKFRKSANMAVIIPSFPINREKLSNFDHYIQRTEPAICAANYTAPANWFLGDMFLYITIQAK